MSKRDSFSGVYGIFKHPNDQVYIGSSRQIKKRWAFHRYAPKTRSKLHAEINRLGVEAFDFVLLESISPSKPSEYFWKREQYWMDCFPLKYNIEPAGPKKGMIFAKATRVKMAKAKLGNKNRLGTKHTAKTKAKISAAKLGFRHTEKAKTKISAATRTMGRRRGKFIKRRRPYVKER